MSKIIIKKYIWDLIDTLKIKDKFENQVNKIKNWQFDKWLWFEKIEIKKWIVLYSFRIDIHYRAFVRKENWCFIIFDVNNHDYKTIIKKLKS